MDSMAALTCKPNQLLLVFKKPVLCSSISANGSEFTVNGTYPVAVTAAGGNCVNGTTKEVLVTLSAPLFRAGDFQLLLQRGSDGNTLLDECGEETPVGSALSFSVKDTVNAAFTYTIGYSCERDTVRFFHNGANGVTTWHWQLAEAESSTLQNPVAIYTVFNQKRISLAVSNGFCVDSSEQVVTLENALHVDFTMVEDNCPNEAIQFSSDASGRIVSHFWEFGDGATSSEKDPQHTFSAPVQQRDFPVRYSVLDQFGCTKTIARSITIYPSCLLSVPNAFTPNGDGKNDLFRVLNAVKAEDLELVVYNRWGQVVFRTRDWRQGWDGRLSGQRQPAATYVWMLRYTHRDTKKQVMQKGTVTLIR
jgi:gliding motility-associated-like protein